MSRAVSDSMWRDVTTAHSTQWTAVVPWSRSHFVCLWMQCSHTFIYQKPSDFQDAWSSILSSLQLLSSRPSIPLTSIWHIAFHHLTSVTGDTSWPLETWGMKLGKSVRNIRCGHNYRDRQADLAKLGLKFKKTPVGPTSAKPDPSACPPKIEPDPDPTSPPVISSTSTIPIPTPPSEASPANWDTFVITL